MKGLNPEHASAEGRVTKLANVRCPYCDAPLDESNSNQDHVVGKNFVPRGTLNGCWNLIVRACKQCNANKAALEDDISAITLHADAYDHYSYDDPAIAKRAVAKALKSRSRLTKRTVADSIEFGTIRFERFGAEITFGVISPPRIHPDRSAELAFMQLLAFTMLISYDEQTKCGAPRPSDFVLVNGAPRSDWGNVLQRVFMAQVSTWESRLLATTAGGFFRIAIRRCPTEFCWSWVLEWNKQLRLIGYFGNSGPIESLFQSLPDLERSVIGDDGTCITTIREEVGLSAEVDDMFTESDRGAHEIETKKA